jgi:hypothetical protein
MTQFKSALDALEVLEMTYRSDLNNGLFNKVRDALEKEEILKTKVEEFIEPKKVEGKWKPRFNEKYWCVQGSGIIFSAMWYDDKIDYFRLQTNNVFRTSEDAETWLKVHDRVHELIGDWEADWGNSDQIKYSLVYDHNNNKLEINDNCWMQTQGITFMPEHAANTLLKEFTTPELLIWMGIKR